VLREIAPRLWVAEQPLRYRGFELGRRMAVICLSGDRLLIHSPSELTEPLRAELDALGQVRYVVPASLLHGHLFMEQFQSVYPHAELFAVPGLERKRRELRFAGQLDGSPESPWAGELEQTPFRGYRIRNRLLNEIEFLHRPTRTLITGDLCFNIGPDSALLTRLLAWGPRLRPRLGPSVAFRFGVRDRDAARRSLERLLAWDFDRILPGHGEIVESGGKQLLRRDFAWLLG
jgi:Domain of unknown function (DUF4336)